MSQVIKLVPKDAAQLVRSNADLAGYLRDLADNIEQGEFGDIKNMLNLFVKENGRVQQVSFGGPELSSRYVIGMLEEAKVNVIDDMLGDDDED